MDNNFNTQEQYTTGAEKTAPWFLKRDVSRPEKGYNPYREPSTVLADSLDECKHLMLGPAKLDYEQENEHKFRLAYECAILKGGVFKRLRKDASFVALCLFTSLMMIFFLSTAIGELKPALSERAYGILSYVFLVLQYLLVFPPILYLATLGRKNKVYTYFKKPAVSAFYVFRWTVIAFGSVYVVSILSNLLFALLKSAGIYVADLSAPLPSDATELILYFIGVVILAPIFEELLFRGVLLTPLMKYGAWFSATVTGFLFGAYHQNHQQMFFAMAFGIILAFIDIKAGSIIPSLIAHVAVNLYSFISTFALSFTNYEQTLADPSVSLDGPALAIYATTLLDLMIYVIMIVAIIGFVIEIFHDRDQFKISENPCGLSAGEKNSAFFASPAMIGVMFVLALFIALNSFIDLGALTQSVQ